MKLIAVNTIHGRKVTRARNPSNPKDRGASVSLSAKPGAEFDTTEFGIDAAEAQRLLDGGFAKRKMREVTEADEAGPGAAKA